jgi:hypothetical protein
MSASAIASSQQPARGMFVVSSTMRAGWSVVRIAAMTSQHQTDRPQDGYALGRKPVQADAQRPR